MQVNQDFSTENNGQSSHCPSRLLRETACFVGSFDPFHEGHKSVIVRALQLFDRVIVGVGVNPEKHYMFSETERTAMIREAFAADDRITVESYSDLTIDFARRHGAQFLVKGVRNAEDFIYEQRQAEWNKKHGGIETILLPAEEELKEISSTNIKNNPTPTLPRGGGPGWGSIL